ncbi:MAG: alcohol dehydrogenase catalytic domain-containing protein [Lentisphaeria bacterium]|nr:alcohol dehydrogenase catalytic domain-containing protein [Lentisphaeria bacterium]
MKTRSFFGKKYLSLDLRELTLEPGPADVIVKVHACGVCGTDLNFLRDWEEEAMPLGHEIAGEVVFCGPSVRNVKEGDMVTVEDCSMCGSCPDCKSGHPEFCRNLHTLNGFPGMGEYVMVNCGNLNVYTGLDPLHACLTEPLAVALAAVNKADIPVNGSVMIFGTGPIGLLTAALAKHRGAGFVGISGRSADTVMNRARLALAEKIGCDLVVTTQTQDLVGEVKKLYPAGVDRVIVTSPPASAVDAFEIIRFGGAISLLGLSFKGDCVIPLDVNAAIFNKTAINTVFAEPAIGFGTATELIKRGVIDASLFQTHAFGPDQAQEVLKANLMGTLPIIKSVFMPFA